jgi:hypothetical protein
MRAHANCPKQREEMGTGGAGWLAVFADVGVTFFAVLNSLRLLAKK